jgi:hypothetical protein
MVEDPLTPCAALFFAPGTGSLRFEKGRIFTLLLISAADGLGSVESFEGAFRTSVTGRGRI